MPRSKKTVAQKAAYFNLRALHLTAKAELTHIKATLTLRPDIVNDVKKYIQDDLGVVCGSAEPVTLILPPSPRGVKRALSEGRAQTSLVPARCSAEIDCTMVGAMSDVDETSSVDSSSLAGDALSDLSTAADLRESGVVLDEIPVKYQTFSELPAQYLCYFLSEAEEFSLSKGNMRNLIPDKGTIIPKGLLLEVFNFAFGIPKDTVVRSSLRVISEMRSWLLALYEFRGSPCHNLVLPFDWAALGVYYSFTDAQELVIVVHRFSQVEITLPAEYKVAIKD